MKMKKLTWLNVATFSLLALGSVACSSDREEVLNEEISVDLLDSYAIDRFKVLEITPKVPANAKLTWKIQDSLVSESANLEFISPYTKTYPLTLTIEINGKVTQHQSKIIVNKEAKPYSRFIEKVLDFLPAPGQFTNELPMYDKGNTHEDIVKKADREIAKNAKGMISLGGFGGYVVFKFDHTVANLEGPDFKVLGNTFDSNSTEYKGRSSEPGVIMVAYDRNKNGKPDEEEWYEIAGSEYFKETTIKNYSITYFKPDENKEAVTGDEFFVADKDYIRWEDNQGGKGYLIKNVYHEQSYYPLWKNQNTITFTGTKMPDNYVQNPNTGIWETEGFAFGYADNAENTKEEANIDISWAVDKNGKYVKLPGIDFVKIYTGIRQEAGWLGEVSTEVAGAYDLRLK
ncbi:cell surface protein [Elizabethkingia sp. JS20170427COW]|uniref:cell surface protein n=1 Tax=Elizabethkingia sp. JS20170427COW TaxID=2583851 RepID=UPI0011100FE9|nr:cell surface protein [Elizabethkingia sp. JS20170427COW]QCX52661.1 cell surface protein [Elizabethkingia sp. JS20170427COW]